MPKQITISRRTWEALREFNESQVGHGIDSSRTTFSGDQATFTVGDEVAERLAQLDPDPDAAILRAIGGGGNVQ